MADEPSSSAIASKLLVPGFQRATPDAQSLSDPICDTPMVVTLDELRPYDLNPRVTRNPKYEDIKASIRERGLDAPPSITRRPDTSHYMIRNGGNTRLAILGELWAETRLEHFYRIPCLFRPWPERGDIVALTGHLAENDLRGSLSFIERALGVEKVKELYERESGKPLSQSELSRRLAADGFPVPQSHISRMQEAIRYLLPAIPSVLYAGLGRPQVERLTVLRHAAARAWERHGARAKPIVEFSSVFHEVLELFEGDGTRFHMKRFEDELTGRMAELLGVRYDVLNAELIDAQERHRVLARDPSQIPIEANPPTARALSEEIPDRVASIDPRQAVDTRQLDSSRASRAPEKTTAPLRPPSSSSVTLAGVAPVDKAQQAYATTEERVKAHIVTPAATTKRLEAIQRTIADATGDSVHDFKESVLQSIPVQAGGLHPISDVWYIDVGLETVDRLRTHIAQLAVEIAAEADVSDRIESLDDGIGYACTGSAGASANASNPAFARAALSLLSALSAGYLQTRRATIDAIRLADDIAPLLQGRLSSSRIAQGAARLSDAGLVKLFRLIRLARRLIELEVVTATANEASTPK